jgi:ADP-ribose pyrophosphatase
VVVPVLDADNVVMIRNYRISVDQRLWEFPAGKMERGENPSHAAQRELEEETGYRAAQVERIGEFYTSPGFADELMHAFVAGNLQQVGQRLEVGEDIEVRTISRAEALMMVRDGRLRDGKSIAALLMVDALQRDGRNGSAWARGGAS